MSDTTKRGKKTMHPTKTAFRLALLACLPGLALAANPAASPSGPYSSLRPGTESKIEAAPTDIDKAALVETSVEVIEIDQKRRLATVRSNDGRVFDLKIGDDVTNLGTVKPGDFLEVTYYVGKALSILPPGSAKPGIEKEVMQGDKAPVPGVAGKQITRTGKVVSVDKFKKTVTFIGADNRVHEMALGGTDLEHYLDELKKDDVVQVAFVEAVALTLKPAKR
jgi:hypothetical protein